MTFPFPLVRIAAFSGLVLAVPAPDAPAQSPEAQFTDALKIFQRARDGDSGQIEPAIAAFDALARAEPQQPLYTAYLGSAQGLRAREAWFPWNKLRYAEEGLDRIDRALAALQPEHDRASLRGVPVSLETRLVAASTFLAVPDAIFHRRAAAKKLLEELLRHPALAAAPAGFRAAVHVQGARAAKEDGRAQGERTHLKQVLSLAGSGPEAELVALTGPSGSGKSTLLNLCGLIDAPDAGEREIAGVAIDGCAELQLTRLRREKLGFVFQSFNLVPVMSAYDNVEYPLILLGLPRAERRARVGDALARVGLGGLAARLPDALSGGQRQRVAIARALVKSPALVIADEPTGNLDSATAAQIVELLRSLARERGAAAVVATHDERMTRYCDRVLRLVDGEMQDGEPR